MLGRGEVRWFKGFVRLFSGAEGGSDAIASSDDFTHVAVRSGANLAGLQSLNVILKFIGAGPIVKILQVKYLNNILEQDHRFIKRIMRPMLGFEAFHSAAVTLAGIKTHMIRKRQVSESGLSAFRQFAALAA
jgi:putative transposase